METAREQNRRVNAAEVHRMRSALDGLLASPAPARAFARLVAGCNLPGTPPFERYVGMVLRDAGCQKLANLPPGRSVILTPPGNGRLAKLSIAQTPTPAERALLASAESALNRICDLVNGIEDSPDVGDAPHLRTIHLSVLGSERVTARPSYRSANVALPPIGRAEKPTLAYLCEVDWRMLDHVAVTAKAAFQRSLTPNMHQSIMGAFAHAGSDWDVRTRLAKLLASLELSLHVDARFDCNVGARAAAIRFTVPSRESFPRWIPAPSGGGLEPCTTVDEARMAYTARLSCLFAAACFGAGRHIEHAFVTAEAAPDDPMAQPETTAPEGGGQPVMTCAFNRESFVRETLSVIGSGELASPRLRFSPHDAFDVMKPEACSWRAPDSPDGPDEPNTLDATPITPLDENMFTNRIPVHRDTRPLPADMQQLFHTGRICDIDTQHPFGSHIDAVQAARADAGSSGIASIAHLESIIEDLEAETVPPDDDAGSRPLFCPNPLARAALPLLDDDLTIAGQAEAFLRGGADPQPAKSEGPRFFRAPNALFDAHRDLSLLYERLGDLSGAAAHADRCIALAPTTAQAYERKAGVLAQKGRYAEAANVAIAGLEATTAQSDAALLYYTLALLLWKLDRKRDAAAVLVYTTALAGEYATKALNAVRTLRKREGGPVIASASPLAASREMARSHIPVVPGDEAKTLVVHAALGLSCADAPAAAAPYAAAMARYFRDDEVIAATARSLARGTA